MTGSQKTQRKFIFTRGIFFFFLLAILAGCSSSTSADKKDSAQKDSSACAVSDINPNGSSELAILMRQMAAWMDSTKSAIQNHKAIPKKPADFNRILTARKTDQDIGPEPFGGHARFYLLQVAAFDSAPAAEQPKLFNEVVRACASCHQDFCHGPIKRINKLYLPEEK